ncbi:MAG: hypothetical protein JF887_00605 [Candidatus Dormibacteraeota bacterium]|uniref:Heme-copper oxidase subunit III family profile domain-containing protein n=1 Tax=Candidatus Amunia macphersoniae TaxID=3127014 RepID=A0A934KLB6_9BACT|nr:hypothetical protein [Candidatus Dormibacteraeota bacterium]
MSVSSVGAVAADAGDLPRQRRTLILGTRLALAANTTFQLSMIFAYLYLRANNFNGGWRPDGIADLSGLPTAIILVLQLACLGAVVVAAGAARRGSGARAIAALALLLAIASLALRWWYQYHLGDGWLINDGTYAATSMLWFGVLIVEVLFGCFWLLSVVAPGPRGRDREATANHLRAFAEYWGYLLVLCALVFVLVRLV